MLMYCNDSLRGIEVVHQTERYRSKNQSLFLVETVVCRASDFGMHIGKKMRERLDVIIRITDSNHTTKLFPTNRAERPTYIPKHHISLNLNITCNGTLTLLF